MSNRPDWQSVLFVCTGNICRSPTAEAVFADTAPAGVTTASAGTYGYHQGDAADPRAVGVAARRGIDMGGHRARAVTDRDFYDFDLIVALDRSHLAHLRAMAPADARAELALFMDFAASDGQDVPDPYYGGRRDFEDMMTLIEDGVAGILARRS